MAVYEEEVVVERVPRSQFVEKTIPLDSIDDVAATKHRQSEGPSQPTIIDSASVDRV